MSCINIIINSCKLTVKLKTSVSIVFLKFLVQTLYEMITV